MFLWRRVAVLLRKAVPSYAQVAALYDECVALPVFRVTTLVSESFSSVTGAQAEAKALAWAEAAKLAVLSGEKDRAAAVLAGLPSALRPQAEVVLREGNKEPSSSQHDEAAALVTLKSLSSSSSFSAPSVAGPSSIVTAAVVGRGEGDAVTAAHTIVGALTRELLTLSTDAVVRKAFELKRQAPRNTSGEEANGLAETAIVQACIFSELQRRGKARELVQCIVNWQRRGLVSSHGGSHKNKTHGKGSGSSNFFDAVAALQIFLTQPRQRSSSRRGESRRRGGADGVSSSSSSSLALTPREVRLQVLAESPQLFALCVSNTTVADHIVRYAVAESINADDDMRGNTKRGGDSGTSKSGVEEVTDMVQRILQAVEGALRPPKLPAVVSAHVDEVETLWRGAAVLLRGVQGQLRGERKSVKETLLASLTTALTHTVRFSHQLKKTYESGSAAGTQQQQQHDAGSYLSTKTRTAISSCVESTCVSLLLKEAQARFVGLRAFADISTSLCSCGIAAPNALAQCLFLCLAGNATRVTAGPLDGHELSTLPRESIGSKETIEEGEQLEQNDSPAIDALQKYLSAAPLQRWHAALELLVASHAHGIFRVTAAHLRCLLSGLQSLSVVATWQQALACTAECERAFHTVPDETTLAKLLLNLSQDSWQRAFTVLDYYKEKHVAPSPMVLRDLHVVAVKYAPWETTLGVMTALQESGVPGAVGFMNHVYCLSAAASAGKVDLCMRTFCGLVHAPRRSPGVDSPMNELTVAVAATGMLDAAHFVEAAELGERMLKGCTTATITTAGGPLMDDCRQLTVKGAHMAAAARVLGLLFSGQLDALSRFLASLQQQQRQGDQSLPTTRKEGNVLNLSKVMNDAAVLQCLLGMRHLNAPIRLVFDVFAAGSYSYYDSGDSFETRQQQQRGRGSSSGNTRKPLYIPLSHKKTQLTKLAEALADFSRKEEGHLSESTEQALATSMTSAGVGPEYLRMTLM